MSVELLQRVQDKHLDMMTLTNEILGHVLKNTTQEQATTLHDGPEGWTILEVVCHLRDFDTIFRERAEMILAQDMPDLPAYDHEAMADERDYNGGELAYVYDEFVTSRKQTRLFFEKLQAEDWQRTGMHPEKGTFTLVDAVMQVVAHDIEHLEQITRILEQEEPGSGSLPSSALDT